MLNSVEISGDSDSRSSQLKQSIEVAPFQSRTEGSALGDSTVSAANRKSHSAIGARLARRVIAWTLRLAIRHARRMDGPRSLYLLQRLASFAPRVSVVHIWLARVAVTLGHTAEANAALRAAMACHSSKTCSCYWRVAEIQLFQGDLDAAEATLVAAEHLFPGSPRIWELHGQLHRFRVNTDEAVRCFDHAFTLAATNEARVGALWGLADSFVDAGRKDAASAVFQRIIEIAPDATKAYRGLVDCQEQMTPADDVARSMIRLLASRSLNVRRKQHLHYALGRIYDRNGRHGEAFAHFKLANEIRRCSSDPFQLPRKRKNVDGQIAVFNSKMIAELSRHGCHEDFLICIVGMPRSGTTIIEQILSTHAGVRGLGERLDFYRLGLGLQSRLRSRKPFPLCCTALSPRVVHELSQTVRRQLFATAGDCRWIVTKLPEDFWNLGLIKILFPNAKIVHCRRNPLDTCLSCFMQDFSSVGYATDMNDLAEVYRLYRRIMRHWHTVLPLSSILEVSYEHFVAEPDRVIRTLCDFCEIPFNENWSQFHNYVKRVDTASKYQVRRPIYQTSVQKWTKYAEFLGPLLQLEED